MRWTVELLATDNGLDVTIGADGPADLAARVVAVSCNPATFARDARTLLAGGYTLDSVQVFDQFRWCGHNELVGVFRAAG